MIKTTNVGIETITRFYGNQLLMEDHREKQLVFTQEHNKPLDFWVKVLRTDMSWYLNSTLLGGKGKIWWKNNTRTENYN